MIRSRGGSVNSKPAKRSSGHWGQAQNRRRALDEVLNSLSNQRSYQALYDITENVLIDHGMYGAVRKYSASPSLLIMAEFPEHAWMPWKFSATMKSWWPNLADNFRKGDPVAEAVMRQFIDTDVAQEVFPRIDTVCYSEWVELCQRAAASDSTLPPLSPTTRTRLDHFTDVETRKGYDALVQIIWRLFNDLNKTPITPQSRTTLANAQASKEFWNVKENRRKYLLALCEYLQSQTDAYSTSLESLYYLTKDVVIKTKGRPLLEKYHYSVTLMVMNELPEHEWKPWRFLQPSTVYWKLVANKLAHGDSKYVNLAKDLLKEYLYPMVFNEPATLSSESEYLGSWQNILQTKSIQLDSRALFILRLLTKKTSSENIINSYIRQLLKQVYPQFEWVGSRSNGMRRFTLMTVDRGFWDNPENHRKYLDFLKAQLGDTYECLYHATRKHFNLTGGYTLLRRHFNNSPAMSIMTVYKEHQWKPWKFSSVPKRWWRNLLSKVWDNNDSESQALLREYLEYKSGISPSRGNMDEWYHNNSLIHILGRNSALRLELRNRRIDVVSLLRHLYPTHAWEPAKFERPSDAALARHQRLLSDAIYSVVYETNKS